MKNWFCESMARLLLLALLLALSACGGGDDGDSTAPGDIGTLAYVATECRGNQEGFFEHQALHILHGDREVTVMDTPEVGPVTGMGFLCRSLTLGGFGEGSIAREAFQGVAVSPDGAAVVFELSDDFSRAPRLPLQLPADQKGIFFVRADGSGLRRLGPPSRLPFFFILDSGFINNQSSFAFSPDGRTITFGDIGPDAAGNEVAQVMTLDVNTGQRRQVTQLPLGVPPADRPLDIPGVLNPVFIDNQTIGFFTDANPDGAAQGKFLPFTVRSDGAVNPAPVPVTLPDSQIVFTFAITGNKPAAITARAPGPAQNDLPAVDAQVYDVFAVDGANLLQLTNFHRVDTGGTTVDVDRQTVYFTASADPFGTNPSKNCQVFSIDRIGGNLRQLTQFSEAQQSTAGCFFYSPPIVGCAAYMVSQDSRTRTLIFYLSCNPLGTNPRGGQLFAMRPDGSGLRQLTHTQGLVTHPGEVIGELPGPFAYGPYAP